MNKKYLLMTILILISLWETAYGLELQWTAPTTSADGSALVDLQGYKVYWGIASGKYTTSIDVGNVTKKEMPNIEGVIYYTTSAYDTSGNESGYSNEVMVTWKNPPDGSQIKLNALGVPIICNGCTLIINGQTIQ